jgi:hypothetical protein
MMIVAKAVSAIYVIGGGFLTSSGGSAETSCSAVGLQDITTIEECQSAVEQVGIAIKETVGPGSWGHVPYGCTVQQGFSATPESGADGTNGRVHFSTTSGDNNGGNGGYVLICNQAPTPSLTPAPTPAPALNPLSSPAHTSAQTPAPTQAHEVASSDAQDIVSDLPRIAVMISGITFEDSHARLRGGNLVDQMIEDVDHQDEGIMLRSGPRPWDTFKKHVLGPLKRDFQERVDVFVCTNQSVGAAPEEVTAVFTINSTSHTSKLSFEQFDRSKACFSNILEFGRRYTYFMKVRPDFVFLTDIEDYSELRRDCMHTRFQRMWNIEGIQRCHSQLIYGRCSSCNGELLHRVGAVRFGWIVDDMVFVAPFELATTIFMSSADIHHWTNYAIPNHDRWIDNVELNLTTEGSYTNALILNKVPVCPLCINGWPKGSHRDWHQHQHECDNANATYACGRYRGSVDEWVEYIKTGRVPSEVQRQMDRERSR